MTIQKKTDIISETYNQLSLTKTHYVTRRIATSRGLNDLRIVNTRGSRANSAHLLKLESTFLFQLLTTKTMETTINQAVKLTTFGVQNLERFKRNYEKKTKYDKEIMEFLEDHYNEDTYEAIVYRATNDYYRFDMNRHLLQQVRDTGKWSKSTIRMIKTWINGITWKMNCDLLKEYLPEMSEATRNQYASRAYLLGYKRINKAMKRALEELIQDYL